MKHVLYLRFIDEPSYKNKIVLQALKRASCNQDVTYEAVDYDGTEQDFMAMLKTVIKNRTINAVVVSSIPFGKRPRIEQEVPLFDLDYMFGRNNSDVCIFRGFSDNFPHLGFGVDKDGNFHGSADVGWNSMIEFGSWFKNRFGGSSEAPPQGHLGGEVGDEVTSIQKYIGCGLFGVGVGSVVSGVLSPTVITPVGATLVGRGVTVGITGLCVLIVNRFTSADGTKSNDTKSNDTKSNDTKSNDTKSNPLRQNSCRLKF